MHTPRQFKQRTSAGEVSVSVSAYPIAIGHEFFVPYEGSDPLVRADFPDGFPPSYGSGIALKEQLADGALLFYCLTDRGPNGDGPLLPRPGGTDFMDSKIFPAPGFVPSIGVLRVDALGAALVASTPIRHSDTLPASGLPLPPGDLGNSAELALHDSLRFDPEGPAGWHPGGIDSEALAYDNVRNALWVADEYGPFLMNIDPASGLVRQRYAPGAGLPAIMAQRRANRGMEGMTFDAHSGHIHGFLQSPVDDGSKDVARHARFLRWIEFDPATATTVRMLAYPLAPDDFKKGRTGNAKLGDIAALGHGKFVVIEQGDGPDGRIFNHLMLLDAAGATDIGAPRFNPDSAVLEQSSIRGEPVDGVDWTAVTTMKKSLLLDLNALGWAAEKAEGLALVDRHTLAITNDSDFGMKTRVYDATGEEIDVDITACKVDADGRIMEGAPDGATARVAPHDGDEGQLRLWLLRFAQPLDAYPSAEGATTS